MEQLLTTMALNDPELCALLATYYNEPAFFYEKAPLDHLPQWNTSCFPRVDFDIQWKHDTIGHRIGTLSLHISVCNSSGHDVEKKIENRFLDLMHGVFFTPHPEDATTYGVMWSKSTYFSVKGSDQNAELSPIEVYGIGMEFDILGFPPQGFKGLDLLLASNPLTAHLPASPLLENDPVDSFYQWMEKIFPDVLLLSYHTLPPIWKPSYQNPALYCTFDSSACSEKDNYSVNWFLGELQLHLFTSFTQERSHLAQQIISTLKTQGELILADGSPFFLKDVTFNPRTHPFQGGQVTLRGEYGEWVAPQKQAPPTPLRHAYYTGKNMDSYTYKGGHIPCKKS